MLRFVVWVCGILLAGSAIAGPPLTFKLPTGWQLINAQTPPGEIDRLDPQTAAVLRNPAHVAAAVNTERPDQDGYCMNVSARLMRCTDRLDNPTVDRIVEDISARTHEMTGVRQFTILGCTLLRINGVVCARIQGEVETSSRKLHQLIYLLPHRSWLAILTYSATSVQYEGNIESFDTWARSTSGIEAAPPVPPTNLANVFVMVFIATFLILKFGKEWSPGNFFAPAARADSAPPQADPGSAKTVANRCDTVMPAPRAPQPRPVPEAAPAPKPAPPAPPPRKAVPLRLPEVPVRAERALRSLRHITSHG